MSLGLTQCICSLGESLGESFDPSLSAGTGGDKAGQSRYSGLYDSLSIHCGIWRMQWWKIGVSVGYRPGT